MEIRRVPMSLEEYLLLPFHPGWKVEYFRGEAVFQAREALAYGKVAVERQEVASALQMRLPKESDEPELAGAFRSAFVDAVEYCGWPAASFEAEARRVVGDFFAGKRGAVSPASRLVIAGPGGPQDGAIVGEALIHECGADSALLDVLFVLPQWQRRGLATAMCTAALNELKAQGKRWLITRWHLGNEPSVAWHRRFGFVEEPDLFNARLYWREAQQELHRAETLMPGETQRIAELREREGRLREEAERLQKLFDEGDDAGAFAFARFRC